MQKQKSKLEKIYVNLPSWINNSAPVKESGQKGFGTIQVKVLQDGEDVKFGLWNGALFKFKYVGRSRAYGPHWTIKHMTEDDLAN